MKLLWHSVAPWAPSGYGQQTALFTEALAKLGHEVVISAWAGLRHGTLKRRGATVVPGVTADDLSDLSALCAHAAAFGPDATLILMDAWPLDPAVLAQMPALGLWSPVDHEPVPPAVLERLRAVRHPIAMSRHGEAQMRAAGISDPLYVPHAVDTTVHRPRDRAESRRAWGSGPQDFVAAMVCTNDAVPSRKNLDRAIKAWARFSASHSDSLLYVHAPPAATWGGFDLARVAAFYDVPPGRIRFADAHRLVVGGYPAESLAALYSAADVLLAPSAGEGFNIPVLEAQACGCPVIVTPFTALAEVGAVGWRVRYDPWDDLALTWQYGEQCAARPSAIVEALESAWEARGNREEMGRRAVEFASSYAIGRVLAEHMLPALETIAGSEGAGGA